MYRYIINLIVLVLFSLAVSWPAISCREDSRSEVIRDKFGSVIEFNDHEKSIFLLFSAHDNFGGISPVLNALERHGVKASFFLTGECLRNPRYRSAIKTIVDHGHYLGPHSDAHLLYVPWEVGDERDSLLVTREEFENDLLKNLIALEPFGIERDEVKWFLTPYEWYNSKIVEWSNAMGMEVVNFTPGIGTNADYTTPVMPNYRSSEQIIARMWEYEAEFGLDGKIMLIHPGVSPDRPDPLYDHLYHMISDLKCKGYAFKSLKQE
jgi:endoglucanase